MIGMGMANLKFVAVEVDSPIGWGSSQWGKLYRLKALRDIPLYSVLAGDYSGYVTSRESLSQDGECWIAYGAEVFGNVHISGSAYIGGKAQLKNFRNDVSLTVSGGAVVKDRAKVFIQESVEFDTIQDTLIDGQISISGNALLLNVGKIQGKVKIFGDASLSGTKEVNGTVSIGGHAKVKELTRILGASFIEGETVVATGAVVENSILRGTTLIGLGQRVVDAEFNVNGVMKYGDRYQNNGFVIASKTPPEEEDVAQTSHFPLGAITASHIGPLSQLSTSAVNELSIETKDALNLLEEIKEEFSHYETDVVKLIKYPLMTDRTNPYTLDMMQALKLANRLSLNPLHTGFIASVFDLEKKFLAAESNALKMASTALSEAELKKTGRASDLLAVALNEASSEQEKKVAFEQAFKQLEGVIMVPDVAKETFKIKIGLKEIEA